MFNREGEIAALSPGRLRRPRVGVDLHVVDGKFQGSRTHVIEIFSRVAREAPEIDFFLFSDRPELLPELREDFALPNVKRIRMTHHNPVRRLAVDLPSLCRRHTIDLLHTQYILPLASPCPGMVTIHDILFETHPQYFERFFRLRSKVLMRHSARQAAHVFTVSEYSKNSIAKAYGVHPDRISVIHNAVDRKRFFPGVEGAELVRARGLVPEGYILTVGRLEPRKNHLKLLEAHSALGPDAPVLVIVGQRDFRFRPLLERLSEVQRSGRAVLLEDVTDAELPALYRHAKVFAYPAFAEGFGIPPLEAMASGVAVVTSNTTSLPEVVGSAGLLVDPQSSESVANALTMLLRDAELRAQLRDRMRGRVAEFDWRHAAGAVATRYRKWFSAAGQRTVKRDDQASMV